MVNVPRIHCHSAFKHYEMFHCNYGSSYGNSVFNTTYNFNGGTMCGGGFWGGLFGGLGMGLGAGLMNFLGGGLFGGAIGMFGGGMNMFGGMPMMNWWGGSGRYTDGAGGKEKVTEKEKIVEKEVTDRDVEVLNNLEGEIQELEKKSEAGTLTKSEKETLKKKAEEEAAKSDKYHKTEHDEHYQKLLTRINKLKVKEDVTPVPPVPPAEVVDVTTNPDDAVNVTLQFAKHDGQKINDQFIKGNIVGVKLAEDGTTPTGYIIDCKDSNGDYKLKYEVTISSNGIYSIRCISKTHNTSSCRKSLYTPNEAVRFKRDENGDLVRENDDGEPLVTEHKKGGYVEITYAPNQAEEEIPSEYIKVEQNGEAEVGGKKVKVKTEGTIQQLQ